MLPLPPRSTRTDTLFPYTTLFRSAVVLNATELRTGTAFRFGSKESGSWRYGRLVKTPTVSAAVAASAAFPALLPLFDEHLVFENSGSHARHRVMLTDGGRSEEHTSELQSLMRISYAVFCLKNKTKKTYTKD